MMRKIWGERDARASVKTAKAAGLHEPNLTLAASRVL